MRFTVLPETYAVCRLSPDADFSRLPMDGRLCSVTRTATEVSIVCQMKDAPVGARVEGGWSAICLEGPIPFEQTGVLAKLAGAISRANIGLFAISTYDTDYVLVKRNCLDAAIAALVADGYELRH